MEKNELRQLALGRRNALSEEECMIKSAAIMKNLTKQDVLLRANMVGLYASYQNEVITYPLLQRFNQLDKLVAFPRVSNAEEGLMQFHYVKNMLDLTVGYHGILEPLPERYVMTKLDLLIMPLVAFDEKCHRIGYGKGFYDRYLHEYPNLKTIALAYECQKVDAFEADAYDIAPDMIITENGIYTND